MSWRSTVWASPVVGGYWLHLYRLPAWWPTWPRIRLCLEAHSGQTYTLPWVREDRELR